MSRLARAAARSDRRALTRLVGAVQGDVWRLCAHMTDPVSANNLARDAYLHALPGLKRLRRDVSVRTWLLTVAYRICQEEAGSRNRAMPTADRPAVLGSTGGQQAEAALPLAALEPAPRGAFVLTQPLGCSYEEATEISGCPASVIRARVARARDDLGRLIAAGASAVS